VPEDYVRPPIVAHEHSSTARAVWRFRIGALLVLALIVYVLAKLFLRFSGIGTEDPGLGGALGPLVTPRLQLVLAAL
jgi:hypothetical protein